MKLIYRIILLLGAIQLGNSTVSIQAQEHKPLIFSIAANGAGNRLQAIEPIAEYLSKELNRPVNARVSNSAAELMDQLESGEIDIAYMNGFGYVLAKQKELNVEILALPGNDKGEPSTYNSCLLANNGAFKSMDEVLENAASVRLLFVNPTSTSGHLIPRLYLTREGIGQLETVFSSVDFGKNHYSTLEKLVANEADVAAMAYNVYQACVKDNKVAEGAVDVLWVSDGIPSEPIVVRNKLEDEVKAQISEALLNLHKKSPELWVHVQNNFSARQASQYVLGKDEFYDSVRNTSGKIEDLLFILNFYID